MFIQQPYYLPQTSNKVVDNTIGTQSVFLSLLSSDDAYLGKAKWAPG